MFYVVIASRFVARQSHAGCTVASGDCRAIARNDGVSAVRNDGVSEDRNGGVINRMMVNSGVI